MSSITAIYENGILRPMEKLSLREGETVEVTLVPRNTQPGRLNPDEWAQRIRTTKSVDEWVSLANSGPVTDDDYDVIVAMNETRRANGERLLTSVEMPEVHS